MIIYFNPCKEKVLVVLNKQQKNKDSEHWGKKPDQDLLAYRFNIPAIISLFLTEKF